jgi:hypothetical protein
MAASPDRCDDLYTYVGNDPTDKTDPTGKTGAIVAGAAIGCAADVETGCAPGAAVGAAVGAVVDVGLALGIVGAGALAVKTANDNGSNQAGAANDGSKNDESANKSGNNNGNNNGNRNGPPGGKNQTGHYENQHESGKRYFGKGTRERSQVSGRRIERETGDKHTATDWKPASIPREAFKGEAGRIREGGGVDSPSNYNKVNSPGEGYLNEDEPPPPDNQ